MKGEREEQSQPGEHRASRRPAARGQVLTNSWEHIEPMWRRERPAPLRACAPSQGRWAARQEAGWGSARAVHGDTGCCG